MRMPGFAILKVMQSWIDRCDGWIATIRVRYFTTQAFRHKHRHDGGIEEYDYHRAMPIRH
jgi:hypothetical protein